MPTPRNTIVCTKKELIAPNVYELRYTKPKEMQFKAGQFLLFDTPLLENPADIQPRAFSIASTPAESDLLFCVKLKEGGRASRWIEEVVSIGTEVSVQGPLGLFTLKENDHELFFVATGAGIAPFRSHIKWALEEAGDKRRMHLIFGVRSQQDFFWLSHFDALAKDYPNLHLHYALSGEDAVWNGPRGRVQTILPTLLTDPLRSTVYICGAPEMVNDVKKECVLQLAIPKAQVHAEGYI